MLEEGDTQTANLLQLVSGDLVLSFWYREISNDIAVFEEIPHSQKSVESVAWFMGKELARMNLVEGPKTNGIYYGGGKWAEVGDLAFVITLKNDGNVDEGYALGSIDPIQSQEVEKIIVSMAMLGVDYTPPVIEPITDNLDCIDVAEGSLDEFSCNLREVIRSGDLSSLESSISNPFRIGYWRSEGISLTPAEEINNLEADQLPEDRSNITFTEDREQFPSMYGATLDNMFGPDFNTALVLYSEGWGVEGYGAVLVYITEDGAGGFLWSGLIIAGGHFDE
jgi:hypothetical protein